MGTSSWSGDAYRHLGSTRAHTPTASIFKSSSTHTEMSPKNLKVRESRDSKEHPKSLAVIIGLDVTGSMGIIPERLVKGNLAEMIDIMYKHNVPDPQIMPLGIGDLNCDHSPLQVGQFESGNTELDKWFTSIYLEGGGGGQHRESYPLAWLVAARHTSVDCWEKRQDKGFIFTIGDEGPWDTIDGKKLAELMGYPQSETISAKDLLEETLRSWHVFHINISEGSQGHNPAVAKEWKTLLGERYLVLDDYNAIGELIASTVALVRGAELATITKDMSSGTGTAVSSALTRITGETHLVKDSNPGIVRF